MCVRMPHVCARVSVCVAVKLIDNIYNGSGVSANEIWRVAPTQFHTYRYIADAEQ